MELKAPGAGAPALARASASKDVERGSTVARGGPRSTGAARDRRPAPRVHRPAGLAPRRQLLRDDARRGRAADTLRRCATGRRTASMGRRLGGWGGHSRSRRRRSGASRRPPILTSPASGSGPPTETSASGASWMRPRLRGLQIFGTDTGQLRVTYFRQIQMTYAHGVGNVRREEDPSFLTSIQLIGAAMGLVRPQWYRPRALFGLADALIRARPRRGHPRIEAAA